MWPFAGTAARAVVSSLCSVFQFGGDGNPVVQKMVLTSTKLLIALLITAAHHVSAQTGSGIIGFGISLYQDLCCQACYDSLSSLYLTCTTFMDDGGSMPGMDMRVRKRDDGGAAGPMGMTSDDCRANNTAWLQTMAYCIQQNCNADGYPADQQAECFSNHAVAGASEPTFRDSLPASPPTVELAPDAVWLNVTSLVNSQVYYETHGTEGEFARSEYMHTRYSYVSLFHVVFSFFTCDVRDLRATTLSQGRTLLRRHRNLPWLWPAGPDREHLSRAPAAATRLQALVTPPAARLPPCALRLPTP
jgi:hypothetical protein